MAETQSNRRMKIGKRLHLHNKRFSLRFDQCKRQKQPLTGVMGGIVTKGRKLQDCSGRDSVIDGSYDSVQKLLLQYS